MAVVVVVVKTVVVALVGGVAYCLYRSKPDTAANNRGTRVQPADRRRRRTELG